VKRSCDFAGCPRYLPHSAQPNPVMSRFTDDEQNQMRVHSKWRIRFGQAQAHRGYVRPAMMPFLGRTGHTAGGSVRVAFDASKALDFEPRISNASLTSSCSFFSGRFKVIPEILNFSPFVLRSFDLDCTLSFDLVKFCLSSFGLFVDTALYLSFVQG